MKNLKKCPCCNQNAEWVEINTQTGSLWQIACQQCDIASCIDDDRFFCLSQWNKRKQENTLKTVITYLTITAPLFLMIGFSLGFFLGLRSVG